jgi:hypothetical protein
MMGKSSALKALKMARRIEVHAYMETLGPRTAQTTVSAERRKAAKRRQKLSRP